MKLTERALGIVGSPRRGGNTEVLVDEILSGAAEAGAEVEKVILSELDIAPCDACLACEETGQCTIGDDMDALFERMARSNVWVLGTPVFWWGPSAQFKQFIDRWYAKIHRAQDKALFEGRRVILAIPMGDSDPETARHIVGMMTDALHYVGATFDATVLAAGVNDPGQVRHDAQVMAKARDAGRRAAGGA